MSRRRCALGALLLSTTAVQAPANSVANSSAQAAPQEEAPEIIVIGERLFPDVAPERSLNEESIAAYGVSTVEDLLDEIRAELDENEEPVFLVNGERVDDLDDIAGYPVEALRQVQVLPRGTATRVGGSINQRVYSLNLRRQMRSATVTVAPRLSTDGDWGSRHGEAIFTRLRGPMRLNVTLRVRDEDSLLESDRDIIQPEPRLPYGATGTVIPYPSLWHEIDPLLSDAAGQTITVAPIPPRANPTLADFVAGAISPASTDLGDFRTLRPDSRNYDLNASFGTRLAPWLTTSANLRLGHSRGRSVRGLPSALFLLGPDNVSSPFSRTVGLAIYGAEPLRSVSEHSSGHGNVTFNATVRKWRATLNARHAESDTQSRSQRPGLFSDTLLDNLVNPFAMDFDSLSGIAIDRFSSRTRTSSGQLTIYGSPVQLPSGAVNMTIEGRLSRARLKGRSSFSEDGETRELDRSERGIRGLIEVPLASARSGFLEPLGELHASVEYGRIHVGKAGGLDQFAYGLSWEPRPFLRLRGAVEKVMRAADVETLSDPVVITPGVRTFDLLRGETVDVTQTTGGNPQLRPESTETKRLSSILRLVPRLGLQLSTEYTDTDQRNLISSLPPASLPVLAAFPDRFVRDANGTLTSIDVRPVNFEGHQQQRLRYGLSLNAPLGSTGIRPRPLRPSLDRGASDAGGDAGDQEDAAPVGPVGPRTRLQLSAHHTLVLKDEIQIRPGLASVDLLEGGAIGFAGGRARHQVDTLAGISSGGLGARFSAIWRGPSVLDTRIDGTPGQLRFSSLFTLNLRAFADTARLVPQWQWAKGTRVSLNVLNLTDSHQDIRGSNGNTPLQYQRGYRDPLGRTVELELRRAF